MYDEHSEEGRMETPAPRDRRLTYDDLLHFPDDGKRHEIIDGEHYVTPSPNLRHQVQIRRVRPGAAAHHRVRPDERPRGLVVPPVLPRGHQRDSRAVGTVACSARGADER